MLSPAPQPRLGVEKKIVDIHPETMDRLLWSQNGYTGT